MARCNPRAGVFPDTREVALTAKILRVPTSGSNLVLTNEINALKQAGYVFAEGIRNTFDFAFAPNGDLSGPKTGPIATWPRSSIGCAPDCTSDSPGGLVARTIRSNSPATIRARDELLDPRFIAVNNGYYHNDLTFPPPPTNFAEPVINLGPHADSYRDPVDVW